MKYEGACHCGTVKFEVEGEAATQLIECNCSHCSSKGLLLWFAPRANLRLLSGQGKTVVYQFNKHVIDHHFCPSCGCEPFAFGKDSKGNEMVSVNMRCVKNVDLAALPRYAYDGKNT